MKALLLFVLWVGVSGCAAFADKADYADYRKVRLAHDDQTRLLAMRSYVERHPDGAWRDSVQSARAARDAAAFESGKSSRQGIERYLKNFPDGVFAAQAHSRLSAIALIEQRKQEDAVRAKELASARAEREQVLHKTWVTRFLGYWLKTLVGLSAWGEPIPDVAKNNPAFSRAFGARPRPRCTRDECVKFYESHFAIPVPGATRVERTLSLLLRLRMHEGRLARAELLMPAQGFSRWDEFENQRVVVDGDSEGRERALGWVQERIAAWVAVLGQGAAPLADYALGSIEQPAIGPNGELTDTTAEDPGAPPSHVQVQDAQEPQREPEVAELVQPKNEPTPDMVFAPLQVDSAGRAQTAPELATPSAAGPLVPAASGVAASSPSILRAFTWRALRIVFFASPLGAAGPAYDGVVIEPARPGEGAPAGKAPQLRTQRH